MTLSLVGAIALMMGPYAAGQSPTPETLERAKKATVLVFTAASERSEGDKPQGSGTGFFVNSTGLCITNNHVVDPGHKKSEEERFKVVYRMGRLVWTVVTDSGTPEEKTWRADVLYQNQQADMAVMQVKKEDGGFLDTPNFLRLRPTDEVNVEMKTWCLGFPGGDSRKSIKDKHPLIAVSSGNVVEFPRSPTGRLTGIVTDVLANPGNSGGPFVDIQGRVVGIATLAGQTEGRAATTILVPASLTQEMIRRAFERAKVPAGVDTRPFLDAFVNHKHLWNLPQKSRVEGRDCITLEKGSTICGSMSDAKITWPSPLGDIEVPTASMAYVVCDSANATAFLDGGDRFVIDKNKASVRFTPEGGEAVKIELDKVAWIGFRTPPESPATPKDPAYVIGGDEFHLSLMDVKGDVKFRDADLGAAINVPAVNLRRIDKDDANSVLYTSTGSRIAGRFADHTLTGQLAWSGTPVKISFANVVTAEMRTVNYAQLQEAGEIELSESLDTSDPRLLEVAKLLDARDVAPAGPKLDELGKDETFRALSPEKQEQVQFLRGEFQLRTGKYSDARETFSKLRRAKVADVEWHSRARLAVLDHHPDGNFNNAPISQPETFKKAARSLADEYERDAAQTLDGIEKADADARGTYTKLLKRGDDAEEKLLIANRLTGGQSDEYVVHLWRLVARLHGLEMNRLLQERNEVTEGRGAGGTGRDGRRETESQRKQRDQKIAQLNRDIESAKEARDELMAKIEAAGFIIDDPDYLAGNPN